METTNHEDVPAKKPKVEDNLAPIVATHYNKIEEKGFTERNKSRIFYQRNFNNWVKSMLIKEYVNSVTLCKKASRSEEFNVLDLCCGKGGDLLKWRTAGCITRLICCDLADVSIKQCEDRYNDMRKRQETFCQTNGKELFQAEFFQADCTKDCVKEHLSDPNMRFDLVSCQFAFHYSFESLPQAEGILKNASECLKPGGYFIGTIPDANEIVSRARAAKAPFFGNDIFKIEFECDDAKPPPLFGAKYHFYLEGVVDCPEFLVHFPTLIRLAEKYDLQLVMKEKFSKFYNRKQREGRDLLSRMQALETFSPFCNLKLHQDNEDYAHAAEFVKKNRSTTVGTLSASEWQIISLYLAFAFQKKKEN